MEWAENSLDRILCKVDDCSSWIGVYLLRSVMIGPGEAHPQKAINAEVRVVYR